MGRHILSTRSWVALAGMVLAAAALPAVFTACAAGPAAPAVAQPVAQWTPLFNGTDLHGWYTYFQGLGKDHDPNRIVQVHDGMIHMYKDTPDGVRVPFGYIATVQEYSNFYVRFQYKFGPKRFIPRAKERRDAGFLYHVIPGTDGAANPWPVCIECQVMEQDTGDIFALGVGLTTTVNPARSDREFMPASAGGVPTTFLPQGAHRVIRHPQLDTDGWNTVEVIVQGDRGVHIVNGKVNNGWTNLTQPDPDHKGQAIPLRHGRLLFQAEGAEVCYRNIEIQQLNGT